MLALLLEAVDTQYSKRWVRQRDKNVGTLERRMVRGYSEVFETQSDLFIKEFAKLKPLYPTVRESATPSDVDPLLNQVFAETEDEAAELVAILAESAFELGGETLIETLGVSLSFDLAFPEAVEYLEKYGAAQVTGIDETTRTAVNRIIVQAADEGWSWQRTADAITDKFESFAGPPLTGGARHFQNRAQLIAVTEIGEAYEAGSEITARRVQLSGIPLQKAWVGPNDSRTSAACIGNLAANWIGLDEAFPSGDMRPLNHPGCRHTAVYRRARVAETIRKIKNNLREVQNIMDELEIGSDVAERYLDALYSHVRYVQEAALSKLGGIPLDQVLAHDASKFTVVEFEAYARQHEGDKGDPDGYARAWLHHIHHNPHHWQHWIFPDDITPKGSRVEDGVLPMPEIYAREMVADWMGANMTYQGSWDMTKWLTEKLPTIRLHSETRKIVADILVNELEYSAAILPKEWEYENATNG